MKGIPLTVEPGLAPGGVVACLFSIDGRLIDQRPIITDEDADHARALHIDITRARQENIAVVTYDGDDGSMMSRMIVGMA